MTAGASRLRSLMDAAHDNAPDARWALLRGVVDLFLTRPDGFSAAEIQHFDAIMSLLLREAAPALRREIAERLADARNAPKGVLRTLAQDDIAVADPVLRRSQALSDADLIAAIRTGGPAQWKSVARRREVSEALSEAIVDRREEESLLSLAKNQGARFSLAAMQTLIGEAKRMQTLQEPLTGRYDLPPQLLTQLYFFVSTGLKREILKRSDLLDPSLVDLAAAANRSRLIEHASRDAASKRFIVDKMRASAIDEELLKSLLADKRHAEFVYALAFLAGVDLSAAQEMLKDQSFESLAIACRATGVERQTFARIVFSLRRDEGVKAKALRILDLYIKVPTDAAERILRFWRMRTQSGRDAAYAYPGENEPLELGKRADGV